MNRRKQVSQLCIMFAFALTVHGSISRGLTPHFNDWLHSNGYGSYGFDRTDLFGGAYGGKTSDSDIINNEPVIFIHGNSDVAVGV